MLTDTHTHLYLPDFDEDREVVMERAFGQGVDRIFLPNIDVESIAPLMALCEQYPQNCFPMLGLHPCSVKGDFRKELEEIEAALDRYPCVAIGEIGLDFYRDRSTVSEQEEAFRTQIRWALALDLPVVIHSRESFDEICDLLAEEQRLPTEELQLLAQVSQSRIRGIFHCFTGTYEQACRAIDLGFYLGIGGVATFKKSTLPEVLSAISLDHIVLETDAPYLAPVPFRGKRNESSYLTAVADKLAEIYRVSRQEIAERTTANSRSIFGV